MCASVHQVLENPETGPVGPEDLNPVEDVVDTLEKVHSRYLWAVLLVYVIGAAVGVGATLTHPVRDWLLFVGMYLVIFAYMITYIKAHQQRQRTRRFFSLLTTVSLLVFWSYILIDRIPARRVFHDGTVQTRPDLPLLWGSITCLAAVGVLLILHWLWIGRYSRPPAGRPG